MTVKEQVIDLITSSVNQATAAKALTAQWPDDEIPPEPPPEPTPTETKITVREGEDLQKALLAAAADKSGKDVRVMVDPSATYTGNFTMPVKGHARNIYVQPNFDVEANLGKGRIDSARNDLPKLVPANAQMPVLGSVNSRGWFWRGVHFANTGAARGIIELGSAYATTVAEVAQNMAFVQCRMHGHPTNFQKRGIIANMGMLLVDRCDMRNIGHIGEDAQCLLAYNGPGPYTIVGSYLEGSTENIMFGGGKCASEAMVPSDILIEGNHLPKNPAWLTAAVKPTIKNLFEIKNAQRVKVRGNLFEHCWTKGQTGGAILFKAAANNEATALVRCHQVEFAYNVVRRAGGFFSINNSEGVGSTLGCKDITIAHNVAYELGTGSWTGNGHAFRMGGGPDNIKILHNTLPKNGHSFMYAWNDPVIDRLSGLQILGNLARESTYALFGENLSGIGMPFLAANGYAPNTDFRFNAFEDNDAAASYPAGHTKLAAGLLTSGGLDASFKPVHSSITAVKDAQGVMVGADVAAIRALFAQHGITW